MVHVHTYTHTFLGPVSSNNMFYDHQPCLRMFHRGCNMNSNKKDIKSLSFYEYYSFITSVFIVLSYVEFLFVLLKFQSTLNLIKITSVALIHQLSQYLC